MDFKGPFVSVLVALGMNVLNTLAGYAIARWAFDKDLNSFLAIVFGSLAGRASILIGLVWLMISVVGMNQVWFSIAFAISSFVALMIEMLFFNRVKKKLIDLKNDLKNIVVRFMIQVMTAAPRFRLLHEY